MSPTTNITPPAKTSVLQTCATLIPGTAVPSAASPVAQRFVNQSQASQPAHTDRTTLATHVFIQSVPIDEVLPAWRGGGVREIPQSTLSLAINQIHSSEQVAHKAVAVGAKPNKRVNGAGTQYPFRQGIPASSMWLSKDVFTRHGPTVASHRLGTLYILWPHSLISVS